jgi:hypothetical protein
MLFPLILSQVGREWTWGVVAIAEVVIAALLLLVEFATRRWADPAYRGATTLTVAAAFLMVWVTVVGGVTGSQHNPANVAYLVFFLTPAVGAFAAGGRAAGLARAMLGTAVALALLTALTVTDPATASDPRGVAGTLLLGGYFTALWLVAAALFHASARPDSASGAAAASSTPA